MKGVLYVLMDMSEIVYFAINIAVRPFDKSMLLAENFASKLFWDALQRLCQVLQELLLAVWLAANNFVQALSLFEIFVSNSRGKCSHIARPQLMGRHLNSLALGDRAELREDIVRVAAIVPIHSARAITNVWGVDRILGPVGRELEVVWANAIAMRIRVAKHSCLQNYTIALGYNLGGRNSYHYKLTGVCGWPNARHHVGWREACLLNILEVIVRLQSC